MKVGPPTTLIAAAVLALTGCGSSTTLASTSSASPSTTQSTTRSTTQSTTAATPEVPATSVAGDATASAKKIEALVPSVVKVVTITDKNDPNPIFGRPGAYISAAVLYEKVSTCTTVAVACGAKLEVYKSEADALARTTYLSGMKRDGMIPGGEFDYLRGVSVLRVFGGLTPTLAEQYHAAFGGELAKLGNAPVTPHPAQ